MEELGRKSEEWQESGGLEGRRKRRILSLGPIARGVSGGLGCDVQVGYGLYSEGLGAGHNKPSTAGHVYCFICSRGIN